MSEALTKLRKGYQEIREKAIKKQMKTVKMDRIRQLKKTADQQLDRVSKENDFTNLEQIDFYKDKFAEMEKVYKNASIQKITWGQLAENTKKVLKQQSFGARNSLKPTQSRLLAPSQSHLLSPPPSNPISSELLMSSFFSQKKSQLPNQVTFKNILESAPVPNRSFKKKIDSNNQEIQRLRNFNYELKRKLQILNPNKGNFLQNQEIRKIQQQLKRLQAENEVLSRENTRLKIQAGSSIGSITSMLTIEEMLSTPYLFYTRDNDLQKINTRNSQYDGLSAFHPKDMDFDGQLNKFPLKNQKGDALSEIQQSRNQYGNSFSLYQMSKSYFSEFGGYNPNQSYRLGIQNDHTAKKNKQAFFKDSGVLVRDSNVDIAYKKITDKMFTENKIKLYLYLSNKDGYKQSVKIDYDYQTPYFQLNVQKKVTQLQAFKQARQAIEITLKENKEDINSHATAVIRVDDKNYKIWLPILFLQFKPYSLNQHNYVSKHGTQNSKKIKPAKIFESPESAQKIIPMLQIEGNLGQLWGVSKKQQGPITLIWRKGDYLEIKTKINWLDCLAFIFLEYH